MFAILLPPLFLFASSSRAASTNNAKKTFMPPICADETQKARSQELKQLFDADQSDRDPLEGRSAMKGDPQEIWNRVSQNDLQRRKRVAEIFGEGCITTADDYYHAAMVFQHGLIPDHFFQAYFWSSRATRLGSKDAKWLSGASLDRYLMNLGYKQIYATQAKTANPVDPASCWCLWPVEETATEDLRKEFGVKTVEEQMRWLNTINKDKKDCKPSFCPTDAKPVSRNSLPGVSW